MDDAKRLAELFDARGNCPTLGDPYRDVPRSPAASLLFDDGGWLHDSAKRVLLDIIATRDVGKCCDAAEILAAANFASKTGGNYSTIYFWR